jgi:hypothetical protein
MRKENGKMSFITYLLRIVMPTETKEMRDTIKRRRKTEGEIPKQLKHAVKELQRVFSKADLKKKDFSEVQRAVEKALSSYGLDYKWVESWIGGEENVEVEVYLGRKNANHYTLKLYEGGRCNLQFRVYDGPAEKY